MKINDLELFLIEVARSDGLPPVESLLVCLTTDSGQQGWGETQLSWRGDELLARRQLLLTELAGHSVFNVEELCRLDVLDVPALACAVETACWDLIGKIGNQPVCHFWGGCFRSRVPLVVRIPKTAPDEAGRLARELNEHGFHLLIVTLDGRPQDDLALVETIRESVEDRAQLLLDGGGRYAPVAARGFCQDLEPLQTAGLMDPLPAGRWAEMASLAQQTDVPLVAADAVCGPRDVMAIARASAAAGVVVDPLRVGGLLATQRCAAVAQAAGLHVALGGRPRLGVGTAAMLQLAAAVPSFTSGTQCDYHQLQDDVLADALEVIDGMMTVAPAPGLGVEVDRAKIERYQLS